MGLSCFSCRSPILLGLEFGDAGFRGERGTGENPLERGKNQQQTQPTYCTRPELNPGHTQMNI